MDPASGTVYHSEDSPPSEGDAKLIERLTNYFGNYSTEEDMIQKMDLNHIQFSDNEGSLKEFYTGFGNFDSEAKKGIITYTSILAG